MVRFCETAGEFLAATQAALLENEAANSVMLGIALRLQRSTASPSEPRPLLATLVDDDGELRAAALRTPPHPCALLARDDDAVAIMAEAVWRHDPACSGVVAIDGHAARFAATWSRLSGDRHRLTMEQHIYELTAVTPPANPAPGAYREATRSDHRLVGDWMYAFALEAIPHEAGDRDTRAQKMLRRIDDREMFLWERDGPVAMAGFSRETPTSITINAVYTPPAHRRNGYASALVAAMSELALARGKRACVLYTDRSNPTSNAIYQRIGYRHVCDSEHWIFER